jgi:transposase
LLKRLEAIPGHWPDHGERYCGNCGECCGVQERQQLAAWLRLVPKQYSSGGKQILLGISKRGDTYLRTLLILGA